MNAITQESETQTPANLEVEQALLGAILVDGNAFHAVSSFLKPEHFFEPIHQATFAVMGKMVAEEHRITPATLIPLLPAGVSVTDTMTLAGYVAHLAASAIGTSMAVDFGRSIHDLAIRRQLMAVGEDLRDRASTDGFTPTKQIEDAIERLSVLASSTRREHQRQSTAGAAAASIIAKMESGERDAPPLSSGLTSLDRVIGGLRRGNLVILAGRPGMLKSGLASTLALNVARPVTVSYAGVGVLFFSMEMTKQEVAARMISALAYRERDAITHEAILNSQVVSEEHRFLAKDAARRLGDLPLVIDPQPALSVSEIGVRIRRTGEAMERAGIRLGLVIVDHLGKVRLPKSRDNRNVELGEVTAAAAEQAKSNDVSFVMLCQLNREVDKRDNKRPSLSDLRESGHIEEDADAVIGLYRESYYLSKRIEDDVEKESNRKQRLNRCWNDLEAIVLKNRHGADGLARLWADPATTSIRDVYTSAEMRG